MIGQLKTPLSKTCAIIALFALFLFFPHLQYSADETLCYTQRITDASSSHIYTGRNDANNPIRWNHTVPAGILDTVVRVGLSIEAYDVDDEPEGDEHDRVYFNGYDLGLLDGGNNSWFTVEKTVPVEAIRQGINNLEVHVDELGKTWKVTIRASELRFYCSTPDPDFSIGATAVTGEVTQGDPAEYSVNLTGLNGFNSAVNLSVSGLPANAAANFTANPLTPSPTAETQLTVTTALDTPEGTYTLTVTGQSGGKSHDTQVTLKVNAKPPDPDFSINVATDHRTIDAGDATHYNVTIHGFNGFSDDVTLSVAGLPAGTAGAFTPNPLPITGEAKLDITTSDTTPTGVHTLTVTGEAGGKTHSIEITLEINAKGPEPDFSISAEPGEETVNPGQSAEYKIKLTGLNGYNHKVHLSIDGLPQGAEASFQPDVFRPTGESELTVTTSENTPVGEYTLTVTGKRQDKEHSVEITLKVEEKPEEPEFEITIAPKTQTINPGDSTDYTVTLTPLNNFSSALSLSVTGVPANVTASFTEDTVTPAGTSQLNITTGTDAPEGNHVLTVTAKGGGLEHSVTATLSIVCPDFTLQANATPTSGPASLAVQFEALVNQTGKQASSAVGYDYSWTFGDGGTSDEQSPSYTYQTPGSYAASVTVTNSCGKRKTASVTIDVDAFEGSIAKSFSVSEAQPGDEVFITIEARNDTRQEYENVTIRDQL
ncbi:MAG: PKD domain-containing protein, partial [bacterium]|nr:PKD domain-containing protein [bacterium]